MENKKRLIDVNAFRDFWNKNYRHQYANDNFLFTLANFPTVDAVEVVHGRWLDIQLDPIWRSMLATCSHCRVRGEVRVKSNECGFAVPDSDHCPNCGAKMDGK